MFIAQYDAHETLLLINIDLTAHPLRVRCYFRIGLLKGSINYPR